MRLPISRQPKSTRRYDPYFNIDAYACIIERYRSFDTRYRMTVVDLPRSYHQQDRAGRMEAVSRSPHLTGTDWDALLAAVTEHICWEHGMELPEWVHEPERFCKTPWMVTDCPEALANLGDHASHRFTPPAFRRHGAWICPRSLDPRGGEKYHWAPGFANTWNLPPWPWECAPPYPWPTPEHLQ